MKLKILNKTENKLLSRIEAKVEIDHAGEPTPSRNSLKPLLATKLESNIKLIIIRSIRSIFGSGLSICSVHIYNKESDLNLHEPKHLLKRDAKEKKAKKQTEEISESATVGKHSIEHHPENYDLAEENKKEQKINSKLKENSFEEIKDTNKINENNKKE